MLIQEVCAVIDAQYGSEGKGRIVQELAPLYGVHVRTGGPNAGHTIDHEGQRYKMQVLPCGWINPDAILVIGPGAVLDLPQLWKEVDKIEKNGFSIRDRLKIDPNASILEAKHYKAEGGVSGILHNRIGSTGHGVGACRHDRMSRDEERHRLAYQMKELELYVQDVPSYLSTQDSIMLEGTQGTGLSLTHGAWPYVTSADTTVGQFLVDAGLPPARLERTILVARTYPIRVAGNSGPLNHEIDWDVMSEMAGMRVEERTTVTNKVRRIGKWDEALFLRAVMLNAPTDIALTFIDYLNPEDRGVTKYRDLTPTSQAFVDYIESISRTNVTYIATGGDGQNGPAVVRR